MKTIKLPQRLIAVSEFIGRGARVIDVGTDHGFLPVYLAQNGLAERIIASDINPGPLSSARRSAEEYAVTNEIEFILAPGLSGISGDDADTIVIAGMGGELIAGIIAAAPWTKRSGVRLILQPQSKIDDLLCRLRENGFLLKDASLAKTGGRLYPTLLAEWAERFGSPEAGLFSLLAKRRDPLFAEYVDAQIKRTEKTLAGMRESVRAGMRLADAESRLEMLKALKTEAEKWRV